MNKFILCFLVIFLTACKSQEVKLAENADECETYGFTKGTESYGQCMLTLSQRDIAERKRVSLAIQSWNDNRQKIYDTYTRSIQRPGMLRPNINCTSRAIGNSVHTRCY